MIGYKLGEGAVIVIAHTKSPNLEDRDKLFFGAIKKTHRLSFHSHYRLLTSTSSVMGTESSR